MKAVAEFYTKGPTRVQFSDKDPRGLAGVLRHVLPPVGQGHALHVRGVQMDAPSV